MYRSCGPTWLVMFRFEAKGLASASVQGAKAGQYGARQCPKASAKVSDVPSVGPPRPSSCQRSRSHPPTRWMPTTVFLGPHRLMLRSRKTWNLTLTTCDLEIKLTACIDWSHKTAGLAAPDWYVFPIGPLRRPTSCFACPYMVPRRHGLDATLIMRLAMTASETCAVAQQDFFGDCEPILRQQ